LALVGITDLMFANPDIRYRGFGRKSIFIHF
jgi:hypothetical protein